MRSVNLGLPRFLSLGILLSSLTVLLIFAGPSLGQDQAQTPPPPAASTAAPSDAAPRPAAKPELPDGEGKAIATEYCQDCHRLTNLLTAHKNADDWRDTVHLMMDRGARLPDDQIDTLVKYLAKNFPPAPAGASAAASSTAPASPAPQESSTPGATPPAASGTAAAKPSTELPAGDGKPIAVEYCQDCHRLNNLTMAHKSTDEWNDTVHLMMDRGARIPDDKVDALVQYLAKNFGPAAPGTGPAAAGTTSAPQSSSPATPVSK